MIEPDFAFIIGLVTALVKLKIDFKFTRMTSSHCSSDIRINKPSRVIPALLIKMSIFEKASDIHVEPQETSLTVRYRIDGILHDVMTLPKMIQPALVARIKVLSDLKIDEHRLPQDGRFKVEKDGYKFSLRVSTIPVFDGEKVVMRLLDESTKAMSLEQLGFLSEQLEIVHRNIHKPHGMFLVTGPTGSGKSTTLYAVITLLNSASVNISTIEDPVEYRIERANQMQVNPKIGLTFAVGLRALLRQDPNVIMIGEIGGPDEAEAARWCKDNMKKPVVGFIAGVTAPPGKRMGHAGALISGGADTADAKLAVMEECGFKVTRNPSEMAALLKAML